jgi:hypothetical protein
MHLDFLLATCRESSMYVLRRDIHCGTEGVVEKVVQRWVKLESSCIPQYESGYDDNVPWFV